jgi:hypothetical protein
MGPIGDDSDVRENAGGSAAADWVSAGHEFNATAAQTYGAVSQIMGHPDHQLILGTELSKPHDINAFSMSQIPRFLCNISSFVFNDCH